MTTFKSNPASLSSKIYLEKIKFRFYLLKFICNLSEKWGGNQVAFHDLLKELYGKELDSDKALFMYSTLHEMHGKCLELTRDGYHMYIEILAFPVINYDLHPDSQIVFSKIVLSSSNWNKFVTDYMNTASSLSLA